MWVYVQRFKLENQIAPILRAGILSCLWIVLIYLSRNWSLMMRICCVNRVLLLCRVNKKFLDTSTPGMK